MKTVSNYKDVPVSALWGTLAALLIAIAWLLPNHSFPWTTFHSDAWIFVVLGGLGALALARSLHKVSLYASNIFSFFAVLIPLVQFFFDQLPLMGLAVIAALYTLGFVLAQIAGQQWQEWQPMLFGNIFFGAVGIACIASVGIQIYQWAGLARESGMTDIWILGFDGSRPFANLGQPNQLSTLLLWGLLACVWGLLINRLNVVVVISLSGFITLGLVLAQSRAALIGLVIFLLSCFFWRPFKKNPVLKYFAVAVGVFYSVYSLLIPGLSHFLLLEADSSMKGRFQSELRPAAWKMFFDAVGEHPWLGFGWNQVMPAHLLVGHRHPDVGNLFGNTHNLFLDFFVWSGIPLGVLLSVGLIIWMISAARKVVNAEDAVYFMSITVVLVHAMFEFPLHYAYFLIPTGFFVGLLNTNLNIFPINFSNKASTSIVCTGYVFGILLLLIVMRDYFLVETSTEIVRFEKSHVKTKEPAKSPDVLLLDQLREQIHFFIDEPQINSQRIDLQRAEVVTTTFPSRYNIMKTITLLVLNGHHKEAKKWMCAAPFVMDKQTGKSLPIEWHKLQVQYPGLASTAWVVGESCIEPV